MEVVKLTGQWRARLGLLVCLVAPFLALMAFSVQTSTPDDTLFGQWLHTSGMALPMVILVWTGQWLLPALVAVVAGDQFSSEDHLGTWKTILTRSRTRRQLFAGKVLAASTWGVAVVVVLAGASLVAGLAGSHSALPGLTGQPVSFGRAAALVLASWATQLAGVLAFTGVAVLLSVATRNSILGVAAPVGIGLFLQLVSLLNLPVALHRALPNAPFGSWLGLWTQPGFTSPLWLGVITGVIWFGATVGAAWLVFRRRAIGVA
jgi:ABC-2 type transport system permease protein